jgi:uncharacterized membrane protein YqhA
MKAIIENARYITLISVVASLLGALVLFLWGGYKTLTTILRLAGNIDASSAASTIVGFIELIDTFLVATALYIFAVAIYELFIDDSLNLPNWLRIYTLDQLKTKLSSVIVLFMVIVFLQVLVTSVDGVRVLLTGAAVAITTVALLAYNRTGSRNGKVPDSDDA